MGELETVMRTQDEVEHFHNCREFSQPPQVFISGYANAREKFSIAFRKKHSLKTTKQGKDKKSILPIKTYLPTPFI